MKLFTHRSKLPLYVNVCVGYTTLFLDFQIHEDVEQIYHPADHLPELLTQLDVNDYYIQFIATQFGRETLGFLHA